MRVLGRLQSQSLSGLRFPNRIAASLQRGAAEREMHGVHHYVDHQCLAGCC